MKYILSLVLGLIVVLLLIGVVSKGVMPEGTAVATQVRGTALIFTGAAAGRPIMINDSIAKNDRVEVQGDSRLELRLADGGFMRLSDNARLTMRGLQFDKRTGTVYVQALLDNGKLWTKIKKTMPGSSAEIMTGSGIIAGKDGVFAIDAAEGAGTEISVYQGDVLVMPAGGTPGKAAGENAAAETQPISVQTLQQVSVSAGEDVVQPAAFDLKSAMNDWVRWNLQRDAREGLASITVTPAPSTVTRGHSLQFSAVAHYPDKSERDISSFATWSSSAVDVAMIDQSGLAAGAALGTATISASIEDMSGLALLNVSREILSIKVTPASRSVINGAVQQFKAVGTFSDRTVKDVTSSAVWRSSNSNVAVIDATGRAVAGNAPGTAVISASLGTKTGSARLKVRRALVSIKIMPESAMIMAGETQRFGAVGTYSDGTTLDLTEEAEWESSDIGIAVVDQVQAGRVLGQKAGTATIQATFNGKSGSGTITVNTVNTLSTP